MQGPGGRVFRRKRPDGTLYEEYSAVVDVGKDPKTGKRKQLTKTNAFESEREAWKWIREQLHKVDSGNYKAPTKQTLQDYLQLWLQTIKPPAGNLRISTWEQYKTLTESYVISRLGAVQIQQLEPQQLDILCRDLLEDGGKGGAGRSPGKPLSAATVNKVAVVIHRALKDGVRKGVLVRNVADFADPQRVKKVDKKVWNLEELRTFLEAIREDRLYALYYMTAMTGMRRGEVAGLPWEALDLEAGRLSVRQALTTSVGDYTARLSEVKTGASRRTIDLDPQTVNVLRGWKRTVAQDRLTAGEAHEQKHGLVFVDSLGRWIHPQTLSERFERLVKRAEVSKLTFHGLRHVHATLWLKAGQNVKVLSERLGHSSPTVTLNTYQHVQPGMQSEAAAKVAGLISGESQ